MSAQKKSHKWFALIISIVIFVGALTYTFLFSFNKNILVKINERQTAESEPITYHINHAIMIKTLRQVLEENNYPTDNSYVYDADLDSPIKDVDTVTINKKIKGNIEVDGESIPFTSGAETVQDLLDEKEIRLSTIDFTEPSQDTVLSDEASNIVIHRQTQKREQREEAIPYKTTQRNDENLTKGKTEIEIPGLEGKQFVVEDVKYQDGKPVERNVVEQTVLLEPVNQVVRVGTKEESSSNDSSSNSSSTGNSNSSNSAVNTTPTDSTTTENDTDTPTYTTYESEADLSSINNNYYGTNLSQEDFDLVCAVVEHEGGDDYTSALAVMTCVMNRVDSPRYPNDPVSVLTAPYQFESYFGGYYRQYLGNSSVQVREAVKEVLNGRRIHNYYNFRSYQTPGSEKIGGNWFFND